MLEIQEYFFIPRSTHVLIVQLKDAVNLVYQFVIHVEIACYGDYHVRHSIHFPFMTLEFRFTHVALQASL